MASNDAKSTKLLEEKIVHGIDAGQLCLRWISIISNFLLLICPFSIWSFFVSLWCLMNSFMAVGVQTDNDGDCMKLDLEGDQSSQLDLQKKLMGIWSSTSDQSFGRILISKMFMSCQKDFHQLFGCMSIKMPSKVPSNPVACGSSNASGVDTKHSFHSSVAAKVSYLFTVLTKV